MTFVEYREYHGWSQIRLAKFLGVTQSQLHKWENYVHKPSKLRQESIKRKIPSWTYESTGIGPDGSILNGYQDSSLPPGSLL